jgi:hypothetical protein
MNPIRQMQIRAYIGAAVLAVLIAFLGSLLHRRATSFESLAQGYEMLRARGYHCIGDRHDGKIHGSFIVSRDRLTWNDVASIWTEMEGTGLGHPHGAHGNTVHKPGGCRAARLGQPLGFR